MIVTKEVAEHARAANHINATEVPLLRLPPEIRNRIWLLLLGGRCIAYRSLRDGDPGYCSIGGHADDDIEDARLIKADAVIDLASNGLCLDEYERFEEYESVTRDVAFNLLLTCRQFYQEAALMPFSTNTFVFRNEVQLYKLFSVLQDKQAAAIAAITVTDSCLSSMDYSEEDQVNLDALRRLLHDRLTGIKQLVWVTNQYIVCKYEAVRGSDERVLRCFEGLPLERVVVVSTPYNDSVAKGLGYGKITVHSPEWQIQKAWEDDMERTLTMQKKKANGEATEARKA